MNDEHRSPDLERLEPPLEAAVQAALADPLPEEAIERVKTRARQLATPSAAPAGRRPPGPRGPGLQGPVRWQLC